NMVPDFGDNIFEGSFVTEGNRVVVEWDDPDMPLEDDTITIVEGGIRIVTPSGVLFFDWANNRVTPPATTAP
ncbi:MAG: hypothetical protein FWD86_03180, partial [Firmicutes bacterium]|nr:hypothetical protein [Bacillota bacterium]